MNVNKIVVLVLAFVLAASLAFAAGDGEAPTAAPGEPQYGGTLTHLMPIVFWGEQHLGNYDMTLGNWGAGPASYPFMGWLLVGDVEKYGARGTNEFNFQLSEETPYAYLKGYAAESWEIDSDGAVFHIRPGMMWTSRPGGVIKEPREFTAYDAETSLKRWWQSDIGKGTLDFIKDISAEDKYTLVVEWDFNPVWDFWFAYGAGCGLYAPETIEAGASSWENMAGIGPFILMDRIEGSAITFEKNPLFWEKTTIDGKEYDIPFVDKLVWPLIYDDSTQIASLRTGKLDVITRVLYTYKDELAKSAPELTSYEYLGGQGYYVSLKSFGDHKFTDRNLRRAMAIGTDQEAIVKSAFGDGVVNWQFSRGTPFFTSIEEMPEETRILFEYDPELAKQMIAAAGYPEGFKMQINTMDLGEAPDIVAALEDQWSKIGVDLEVVTLDSTAHYQLRYTREYEDSMLDLNGSALAPIQLHQATWLSQNNGPGWIDDHFNEMWDRFVKEVDPVKRDAILKESNLYFKNEGSRLEIGCPFILTYSWPWAKNYYGEINAGYYNSVPGIQAIWIDQSLKKEMGY